MKRFKTCNSSCFNLSRRVFAMSDANQDREPQDEPKLKKTGKKPPSFARAAINFFFYFAVGVLVLKALGLG